MSQAEEIGRKRSKRRSVVRFMPDSAGRMIFYPFGTLRRGYVVGDARRERELRDWYDRWKRVDNGASLLIVPVILALVSHFWNESRWIAVAAVSIGPIILAQLWYSRAVRRVVIGLERAPPASRAGRRVLRIPPLGIPLGFVALWVPLASWMHLTYAPDRIPLAAGTNVAFYTNISIPLVGVLLLGVGSACLLATLKDEYGRRRMKHCLALVILLPLTFFLLLGSFVEYSRPTPEIAISDDSIVCHRREAKWTDISDIQLVQSRTAALLLDRPSAGERRNVLSCNLGAMTAEPIVVYDAIYAAWQSARSR